MQDIESPTPDETRVVLVKPGDLLIFGNLGEIPGRVGDLQSVADLLKAVTGVAHVVMFEEDIDLAAVARLHPTHVEVPRRLCQPPERDEPVEDPRAQELDRIMRERLARGLR